MAVLALAAGGAYLGSLVGYAGVGWAAGSIIGSLLFNKSTHGATQQEQLMDLRIPGTDYGEPIPYMRGAVLVAGQYWWNTDRRATTVSIDSASSGKGKGSSAKGASGAGNSVTTYDMDALIGLSDNPIAGIRRIFDSGKLIWTADPSSPSGSLSASAVTDAWDSLTVYTGSDTQLPDPIYEADVGIAQACAYRGRGTVMIQGLKLGTSGQVRNLSFEVVVDGSSAMPSGRVEYLGLDAPTPTEVPQIAVVDPNTGLIWSATNAFFASQVYVAVNDDLTMANVYTNSQAFAFSSTVSMCYVPSESGALGNQIWVLHNVFSGHIWITKYHADTPSFFQSVDLGYFGTGIGHTIRYNPITHRILVFCDGGGVKVVNPATTAIESTFSVGVGATIWVPEVVVTSAYMAVFSYGSFDTLDLIRLSDYSLYRRISNPHAGALPYFQIGYDNNREVLIATDFGSLNYTVIDIAAGTVTSKTIASALPENTSTSPTPSVNVQGVIFVDDKYVFVARNGASPIGSTAYVVDPDSYATNFTITYEDNASPMVIPTILKPIDDGAPYIFVFDRTHVKRYYIASNTVTLTCPSLQSVVEGLLDRAGLSATHYDMSDLATVSRDVCSFAVAQITSTRTPLELLMSAYFFEMYMSGAKLKARVRGGNSVITIPYSALGAARGDSMEDPLVLHQISDLEIPAQIALTYTNIDGDYQNATEVSDRLVSAVANTVSPVSLALGLHPAEAKALANTMLGDQAASNISSTVSLLQSYLHLEPTDPITVVAVDGSLFRFRIIKKTDAHPQYMYDLILDEPSVLQNEGITDLSYESSTVVGGPASTLMQLLDIAIKSDGDNDGGFYAATKGSTTSWGGASILNSSDGVSYTVKAVSSVASLFGPTTTALGDWTGPRVFDEINTVQVNIGTVGSPTLESFTRDEILNSTTKNLALVGDEIIQFATATLNSAGVYTLSSLLRGGRGTEWATTGHSAGEEFVLLSTGIIRVLMSTSELGLVKFYKGVTLGRRISSVSPVSFEDTAIGLKPFSPADIRAARDGSNNIVFAIQRRTRLETRMIGTLGVSIPLGEDTEAYEIDVYSDGTYTTVVRAIPPSSSPSIAYSAANQTIDGLTPGNPVYVKVYQISAVVGRGYPLEAVT